MKINDREAQQKAKLRTPFKIQTHGKTFQFILRLNDVRAADYKAEYTDANGRHSIPKGEIFTYKTTLIGERNSIVALTVDGNKTEGYLATETEDFYIESAKKYSSHAHADDKVIYQTKDKVKKDDGICGLDESVASAMEKTNSSVSMNNFSSSSLGRRVVEVATDADKAYVEYVGDGTPASANNIILSVINQADAVYESQLNISIEVTFQHAWSPGTIDPYANGNVNFLRNYWEANFPVSNYNYRRDVAHLFTAQRIGIGGVADGLICSFEPAYSYTASVRHDAWINFAHEIGHGLGAYHPDAEPGCAGTIMQGNTFADGATRFCPFSVTQITNYVTEFGSCLHTQPNPTARTMFDFDADGEADIGVFRPSNFYWYVQRSTAGFNAFQWGAQNDKLAPADFDGDGKTDYAVFRNDTWHIQRSKEGYIGIQLGASGDIPVPADYDGDRRADVAVFRPSTGGWYRINSSNNQFVAAIFGNSTDDPQIGDFDGDTKADYAVFRPSTGEWRIQRTTQGFTSMYFGIATDKPVPADYDGDGKTDIAVYRNDTWHLIRSRDGATSVAWSTLR